MIMNEVTRNLKIISILCTIGMIVLLIIFYFIITDESYKKVLIPSSSSWSKAITNDNSDSKNINNK